MADRLPDPPADPWALDEAAGPVVDPAWGGPLRIGPVREPGDGMPWGSVVVATDALLAHVERLDLLHADLSSGAIRLALAPMIPAGGPCDPTVYRAADRASALAAVRAAEERVELARTSLRAAVSEYSRVEALQRARMIALGEQVGAAAGPVLRIIALLGIPAALGARLLGLPTADQVTQLRRWMIAHPEIVTSPEFVEAVRVAVMSTDEAASSALGMPPDALQKHLSQHGFTGIEAGAILVLASAMPFGLFQEGPVRVDRVATLPLVSGPSGAVERLARVPEGDQVRIERYDAPGLPSRFVVYVGPTETFSPVARTEPWDLTSNVAGVAGLPAGSIRATEQAMRDAGISSASEVQFVGFSQGGLVAARLTADGDWNAVGLETYGAPTGNVELPEGLAGMAVRNTDDFVPALAGPQLDHHLLQVERRAFEPGAPIPNELPAPAHQRSAYVATAQQIDAAASQAVREQITAMDGFTSAYTEREGSRVTVMMYSAVRGGEVASAGAAPPHAAAVSSGGSSR